MDVFRWSLKKKVCWKRKYFVNNSLEQKKWLTTEPTKYGLKFSVSV